MHTSSGPQPHGNASPVVPSLELDVSAPSDDELCVVLGSDDDDDEVSLSEDEVSALVEDEVSALVVPLPATSSAQATNHRVVPAIQRMRERSRIAAAAAPLASADARDHHRRVPIAIIDVDYTGPGATAACIVAERWTDAAPFETHVVPIANVEPYVPGRFFERELPCILAVVPKIAVAIDAMLIDGYVYLDADGTPGLGARLHEHFAGAWPVVGIAKSPFRDADFATPVLRGTSRTPLYVTAIGIDVAEAARRVAAMHGPHRIPTLLGWVDRLAAGDPPAYS